MILRCIKDRWGASWQITPRALTDALVAASAEAERAFEAMMSMKNIDVAVIDAPRLTTRELDAKAALHY